MELELGLKLTSVADEFTSDFQIAKDRSGPLFLSKETAAMFILTAHLKGYKRRNIKIDISEDGALIVISGEKQVKETVMVGWKVYKKDAEMKGFKKVFRIPDGVILDKIEAKFNEDESTLTITMPKKVKGIRRTSIEEIKEKPELVKEGSGSFQIVNEKIKTKVDIDEQSKARNEEYDTDDQRPPEDVQKDNDLKGQQDEAEQSKARNEEYDTDDQRPSEDVQKDNDLKGPQNDVNEKHRNVETEMPTEQVDKQEKVNDIQEITEPQQDNIQLPKQDQRQVPDKANDIHEDEETDEEKEGPFTIESQEKTLQAETERKHECKPQGKRCKMCIPIVAGSTLLLSLVVFVIQMMRSKNQTSRKKD